MSLFYLKDQDEAVDVTQDICIKICKKLESFENRSNVNTWVYRVSKNTILNYLRRKKLVNFISFEKATFSKAPLSVIDKNTPQQLVLDDEKNKLIVDRLEEAIKLLSNREKTAFFLFFYEKLKQAEIAKILKTSMSAVESLIFKSRRKIKKYFQQQD